jgi:methionine synthase II (cobalamin-independent)
VSASIDTVLVIFSASFTQKLCCCRISEEAYVSAIKEEISKVVKIQEELDIDVLVHGEPEVRSVY